MTSDPASSPIEAAFAAFAAAMQEGDTDQLRRLTCDGFTLAHITGYVQPGDDWLAEMRQGQFLYHRIDVQDLRVTVDGASAHLVARTLTDARVYDSRHEWRLQLELDYARQGNLRRAEGAVATLWN